MLSRYIILPFGIIGSILGALAFYYDNGYLAFPAIFCIVVMIGVYFFSDAIDWWWYQKHPPSMDERMQNLLQQRLPFYQHLSATDRIKFQSRVELYVRAKEYIPNGWKKIPYDIQAWVATCPVMLTFHKEDFLLSNAERIVIYPHSFVSPQFPEQFHATELFIDDGVLLFSSEKLLPGVMQPKRFFNIGLYEYARLFKTTYPAYSFPELDEETWQTWSEIVGYSQSKLEEYIGLKDLDHWSVLATLFFSHPIEMEKELNPKYTAVRKILNY